MSKLYFFMNDAPPPTGLHENKRECYFPLGKAEHYDPSLRKTFTSKTEMRRYMATHKLRDAGERVNPSKHISGRPKVSEEARQSHAIAHEWIRTHGGVEGLLRRAQER